MVPRPILLAGAAYVSAVSAAARFVSKPLRPLGYGNCQSCKKSAACSRCPCPASCDAQALLWCMHRM
jgi:hypothetical protein